MHLIKSAECILAMLAKKATVIGLSATCNIDSVLSNYSLKYLKETLEDDFHIIEEEDHQRIQDTYSLLNEKYETGEIQVKVEEIDYHNENLKEARLKSGISQKDLAESIGVAKSTYSLYESGKREPNVDTIKKIASSLNVSADTLLGIDNEPITLAAHFEGDEYTESEVEEIKNFAAFVKNRRK